MLKNLNIDFIFFKEEKCKSVTKNALLLHPVPYFEPCPGSVDYVMIWMKEPFLKNEKSIIDVLISWVNKI